MSSSILATLIGRYGSLDYGKSKLTGEELLFEYVCGIGGRFTDMLRTGPCGQISVTIMNSGQVKAEHWHNTKWELFILVSGHCLIQQRIVGTDEVIEFDVSGEALEAVYLLPGYVHNIINLSSSERADTYGEKVVL